jgi:hypothetical protein
MPEAVLDTNVLAAALRSKRGASYQLIRSIGQGDWRPNISVAPALEDEDVLKRKDLLPSAKRRPTNSWTMCLRSESGSVRPAPPPEFAGPGSRAYSGSCDTDARRIHAGSESKTMSITVNVPEELYQKAVEIAELQHLSVDEVFASAFADQIAAWQRLQQRAARGSREKSLAVLDKVPDVEPEDFDRR